jgi:hypothetical protein
MLTDIREDLVSRYVGRVDMLPENLLKIRRTYIQSINFFYTIELAICSIKFCFIVSIFMWTYYLECSRYDKCIVWSKESNPRYRCREIYELSYSQNHLSTNV